MYSTAAHLFTCSSASILSRSNGALSNDGPQSCERSVRPDISCPIFLDMAYIPKRTHLLKLADSLGWQPISGENAMIEQGFAQQRMWRSGDASAEVGVKEGLLSEEAMAAAIEAVRTAGPIVPAEPEVDLADGQAAAATACRVDS